MAIIERRPLDGVLVEVKLGHSIGEPGEQLEAVGVGTIHFPQSERRSGRRRLQRHQRRFPSRGPRRDGGLPAVWAGHLGGAPVLESRRESTRSGRSWPRPRRQWLAARRRDVRTPPVARRRPNNGQPTASMGTLRNWCTGTLPQAAAPPRYWGVRSQAD